MSEQFDYVVQSTKDFNEVVSSIEALTAEKGFRVLAIHDVQATLAGKGLTIEPMKIVELCSAKHAYRVVTADPKISYMLPCRISVYQAGGRLNVGMMLPTAITRFFPDADIADVSIEVENAMKEIIDQSAQRPLIYCRKGIPDAAKKKLVCHKDTIAANTNTPVRARWGTFIGSSNRLCCICSRGRARPMATSSLGHLPSMR